MLPGIWDLAAKCSAGYPYHTQEAGCRTQNSARCSRKIQKPQGLGSCTETRKKEECGCQPRGQSCAPHTLKTALGSSYFLKVARAWGQVCS